MDCLGKGEMGREKNDEATWLASITAY